MPGFLSKIIISKLFMVLQDGKCVYIFWVPQALLPSIQDYRWTRHLVWSSGWLLDFEFIDTVGMTELVPVFAGTADLYIQPSSFTGFIFIDSPNSRSKIKNVELNIG